jgi:phenol 2-monooxygenase
MNVSMQDAFNLGWKLVSVLRGQGGPELLGTYSAERHAVARELIEFDREWAAMLSAPLKGSGREEGEGVDPAEVQRYFVRHGRYTAGTATLYRPSVITSGAAHQHLAKGFTIGMRFHSAPVIRLADAKPVELGHAVEADGRWRIFAFADRSDPAGPDSALFRLCEFLDVSNKSPLRRYTPEGEDPDSVIDFRAVFQQGHRDLAVGRMHPLLLPPKGRLGLLDYEKMFCADAPGDIFDRRGIDRDKGCMVVVRPDQYVASILPLDAHDRLTALFDGFMPARDRPTDIGRISRAAGDRPPAG